MTKWLEVARKYEGQHEIAGEGSNPVILAWVHAHGRPDVRDDSSIAWCGFFMGGVFTEAGHPDVVPKEPGAAKSWRAVGEPLTTPKSGAIVVIPRRDPANPEAAHVGLIVDFDDKHILVLGGNQSNRVGLDAFERDDRYASYRWPIRQKTPAELAATSRIAAAARRQKRDATLAGSGSTAAQVPNPVAAPAAGPQPPLKSGGRELVDGALGDITWIKSTGQTLADFAAFASVKWQWAALAVALYFGARFVWDSHLIAQARTEDHNEGYTT